MFPRIPVPVRALGPVLCFAIGAGAVGLRSLAAQSVVVDQGTFALSVEGALVGTEEFSIRRAGFGNDAVFIASGVVTTALGAESQDLRTLLRATAPDGAAGGYQVKVAGAEAVEITLSLAGRRFVSSFVSDAGQEEREFRARPGTRIVEHLVAHHFYFLRNLREGASTPVIEPRSRLELELTAGAWEDEEIRLGRNRVSARRVVFSTSQGDRLVWFDRQGRVLRVEVPASGYVAVRQDLVG